MHLINGAQADLVNLHIIKIQWDMVVGFFSYVGLWSETLKLYSIVAKIMTSNTRTITNTRADTKTRTKILQDAIATILTTTQYVFVCHTLTCIR